MRQISGSAGRLSGVRRTKRREDIPASRVTRLMRMAFMLVRERSVNYETYQRIFGLTLRQFQRDLKLLEVLGPDAGFMLTRPGSGRIVFQPIAGKIAQFGESTREARATMRRIASALGEPAERELAIAFAEVIVEERRAFLQVRTPRPVEGTHVADVFDQLKNANSQGARIAFSYVDGRKRRSARRVEPYHVAFREGRYYLVAFDVAPNKGWRYFALDSIHGPFRLDGTFVARPIPAKYGDARVVGWINGSRALDVTIRLSPTVATSILARTWQDDARVVPLADGGAEITLISCDIDEAVRWALRFGSEAVVVGPPEAQECARATVARILAAYEQPPARETANAM